MSVLPEHGTPTLINSVDESHVGQKLSLAGRLMCYDENTGFIVLLDGHDALLVDVSLAVGRSSRAWIGETFSTIQIIGDLEKSIKALPIPPLPAYADAPRISPHLIVRAIAVVPSPDFDLALWNQLAKDVEAHTKLHDFR